MKTLGYLDIIDKYTLSFKEEILQVTHPFISSELINSSLSFPKITEKYC